MKLSAAMVLFSTAVCCLSAGELKISKVDRVVVVTPEGWNEAAGALAGRPLPFPTVRIAANGDRNAVCLVSILGKNHDEFRNPDVLKQILRGDSRPYLNPGDGLAKVEAKTLPIQAGLGFYANFTDPDLAGKPVHKGSYKTATPIILSIGSDYLIKATILCDDLQGRDYSEALEIVKSIQLEKPKV